MSQNAFFKVSGVVYGVVAMMHALRLVRGWEVMIGGWSAPSWASGVAVLVSGFLAYTAFRFSRTS